MPKLKFSNVLIGFLIVLNVLPILAPIFQSIGFDAGAKTVYFIYSFFCHQIHWRSLHIDDNQVAWCARDMAIWGGFLAMAVSVKAFKLNGLKWYQVLPFVVPIALDGGIQTIATGMGVGNGEPIYISTNLMRMITGSIFGMGLGITMMPVVLELEFEKLRDRINLGGMNFSQLVVVPAVFMLIFTSYMGFVQIWSATSENYMPSNAFDSAVKLPEDPDLWLQRRANAVCPANINLVSTEVSDPFALDCFF